MPVAGKSKANPGKRHELPDLVEPGTAADAL